MMYSATVMHSMNMQYKKHEMALNRTIIENKSHLKMLSFDSIYFSCKT